MTPPDGFKIPDHWSRCLELKGKDDVDNCGAATEETSGSQVSGSQASGSQAAGSQKCEFPTENAKLFGPIWNETSGW